MKTKLGIIAYDDVKKDDKVYKNVLNNQYDSDDYEFVVSWPSVEDLIIFIDDDGVSTVNELDRILVLDSGFKNQINSTEIVEIFISLQEQFKNRSIERPYLAYATMNQEVYDVFKKGGDFNGHEIFDYDKTRIFRLPTDQNGSFKFVDLDGVITGNNDSSALSLRTDFISRDETARHALEDIKSRSEEDNNLADLKNSIKGRKGTLSTSTVQQKSGRKKRGAVIEEKPSEHVPVERKSIDKVDLLKNISIKNNEQQIKPERDNSERITISENRNSDNADQLEVLRLLSKQANELRKKSQNNYQTKLLDSKGKIMIAGKEGSGVTSMAANLAEFYHYLNKKVLLINMTDDDDICDYFLNMREKYKNAGRKNAITTNFNKSVSEIAIPANSGVDIITNINEENDLNRQVDKFSNYNRILRFSKDYDIVITMAGEYAPELIESINVEQDLDDLILVTSQENLNRLKYSSKSEKMLLKSISSVKHAGLIINKVQYSQTDEEIQDVIMNMPKPLDKIRLIQKISFSNNWFQQRLTNSTIISFDDLQIMNFEKIAENILI